MKPEAQTQQSRFGRLCVRMFFRKASPQTEGRKAGRASTNLYSCNSKRRTSGQAQAHHRRGDGNNDREQGAESGREPSVGSGLPLRSPRGAVAVRPLGAAAGRINRISGSRIGARAAAGASPSRDPSVRSRRSPWLHKYQGLVLYCDVKKNSFPLE